MPEIKSDLSRHHEVKCTQLVANRSGSDVFIFFSRSERICEAMAYAYRTRLYWYVHVAKCKPLKRNV